MKPAFDDFVLPSKKYADVIIPRGGDNHVAIDLIVQHIRTKLGQHDLCKIYPNVYVVNTTFQVQSIVSLDPKFHNVILFPTHGYKHSINRYVECILLFATGTLQLQISSFIQIV